MRSLILSVAQEPHVRSFITTGAGRSLAKRFVAGETTPEALAVTSTLRAAGYRVALNHLGEAVENLSAAERALASYLQVLDALHERGTGVTLSVKPTHFGLDLDFTRSVELVTHLAAAADRQQTGIRLDMEDTRHTDRILDLWQQVFTQHRNVGVVLQASLHRTPADLERVLALGGSVRLCKGAYAEPAHVAAQDWRDVRASFDRLAHRLLEAAAAVPSGTLPTAAIATHDEWLIGRARAAAHRLGLDATRYELQMLYGVRRDLQDTLLRDGEPVRVYVPWGPEWYSYLTRRLAERPANLMFLGRSIATEIVGGLGRGRANGAPDRY